MGFRRTLLIALAPASFAAAAVVLARPGAPVHAADAPTQAAPASDTGRHPVIQAFLKSHCIECHGEKVQKSDLALHTYGDDRSILKDRKVWDDVLEMVGGGDMPPKKKPRPKDEELEAFTRAVQDIFDEADRNAPPDPGHVTVRRLNRTEYNNTIRDLVGVDFQPADDFPSDDIGHGFDNIGDVLTVSPVLMERYLAAAEAIMQRAILPDPPKSPVKYVSGRSLEPQLRGQNGSRGQLRPVVDASTLTLRSTIKDEGDYVLRLRAAARPAGDEPVRAAILVDGDEVKQFEIKADTKDGKPAIGIYEVKLSPKTGERKFSVKLLNPTEKAESKEEQRGAKDSKDAKDKEAKKDEANKDQSKKDAKDSKDSKDAKETKDSKDDRPEKNTLLVENMSLEGPADTRPAAQRKLLACDESLPQAERTRQVLRRFATRAYRRPATDEEVERVAKLCEQVTADGGKWEAGMQFAMEGVLASPKFLFRLEMDDRPDADAPHAIDEYQLASRLSYFLWSSMPDDELFDLAAEKQLTANLDQQIHRMLQDPRADSLVDNFALQWLQLKRLKGFTPDAKLFPNFDERLRSAMLTETQMFLGSVFREDRSLLDLIDCDYTFLNERLARHYGIADTNGNWMDRKPDREKGSSIPRDKFVRVNLPPHGPRGGLLTEASILAVTSNPSRTSPVKRGKFVLEQILGTPPPPPPPNVPELPENGKGPVNGSLRVRLERHRADPACANCHAKMDPLGFAFESFDAVGAFREKDGEFPIDTSGTLPDGREIKGAADLKAVLLDKNKKRQFARCFTEKLTIYALGRGLEYYDRRSVDKIVAALEKNDYHFSTLVTEIVKSDPFRLRRGKAQETARADDGDAKDGKKD